MKRIFGLGFVLFLTFGATVLAAQSSVLIGGLFAVLATVLDTILVSREIERAKEEAVEEAVEESLVHNSNFAPGF